MFTNINANATVFDNINAYSQDDVLIESACLSTDTKPTEGIANGSLCLEMDTGKIYAFNKAGEEWLVVAE